MYFVSYETILTKRMLCDIFFCPYNQGPEGIMLTIILSFLLLVVLVVFIFRAKERVKKFGYLKGYIDTCPDQQRLVWNYPGSVVVDIKQGMHTVVLRNASGKDFSVLLTFRLELPFGFHGIDQFGYLKSSEGVVVFSTYLGKGACNFIFMVNSLELGCPPPQVGKFLDHEGIYVPQKRYPPHWWQRLGFWG